MKTAFGKAFSRSHFYTLFKKETKQVKENFKKIAKEFLLTDSSLNTYSYRLMTSGYLLDEFKKNPIGYYMHGTTEFPREQGVLVKWEDLRQDGDKVFGKPCINLEHPRGERTVREIESGFLNAASVGKIVAVEISSNQADYLPTQEGPTVTKWFNRECSLVDIPGNYNALTDLVDENDFPINLSDFKPQFKNMKQIFLTPAMLAVFPNLKADTATQDEVNVAFNDLVAKANKVDAMQNLVSTLTTEKDTLLAKVTTLEAAGSEKQVKDLLDDARDKDKKITEEMHKQLGISFKGKPVELKALIDAMPAITTVVKSLKTGDEQLKKFEGKTFDQLDEAGLLPALRAADENKFFDLWKSEEGVGKKHKDDTRED